jgi:precorrin-6A/cobalt-precorrin-6A reductase
MKTPKILVLGGTTEARKLAEALALRKDLDVKISLAGRTLEPRPLPVATRTGGFGGADGLCAYLRDNEVDLLIDATHPFASQMTVHANEAADRTGVDAFALCRPGWVQQPGDNWISVVSIGEAVTALGQARKRVFLAIGRQEAHQFSAAPQHFYLARSVDPIDPPIAAQDCRYILAAGPFALADELQLLRDNDIDLVVTKNSGGAATYAKLEAARQLGLTVIMIERKPLGRMHAVATVQDALDRIDHVLVPVK